MSTPSVATAPSTRATASLAWPIAMNAIFLQSIIIIDTVLVTPLGEEALAALGLASSFSALLAGVLFAFSNGTQLVLAQAFGAANDTEIERRYWSGLLINLIIAGIGLLIIFIVGPKLFALLATTERMAEQAFEYLSIFSIAVVGIAMAQNLTAYFNSLGQSKIPFYSDLIALPINALVSYVLIHGVAGFPMMGIAGAAVGSAVAIFSRAAFLMAALYRTKKHYFQRKASGRLLPALRVGEHFRLALPIAANYVTMTICLNVCMMIYARLGVHQFAALTLLFPWIRSAGHIVNAWGNASGILVGQLMGGARWDVLDEFVSRVWRVGIIIGMFVSAFYFTMFFFFDTIYPDLQQATRDHLWSLMPLLLVIPFIRTSNTMCGNILRAGGDATYVFKVHASTQWSLTVPLSALFVLVLNLDVFWVFAVVLLEECVKSVPFHLRMWSGEWKRRLS